MDHRYGYGLIRQRSGMWRSLTDGDFEEEDVWDVLRERKDDSGAYKPADSTTPKPQKKSTSNTSRVIPTWTSTQGSGRTCDSSSQEPKLTQQSAPVNIPDWSKVVRKRSEPKKQPFSMKSANFWLQDDDDDDVGDGDGDGDDDKDMDSYDDDDDGVFNNNYKAPPHEIIASRLARSHVSSFSVFEGAGRTLKGRDLEKVRNAVLTKTGFLELL